jgi:DNA-3-methyladenine glycosylase I
MRAYHDQEWGVPSHDDRYLFELITLEGAQAGLSWSTVLNKRAHYREVLDGFDPVVVAGYGQDKLDELVVDAGIIRHRQKVASLVTNAEAFLAVRSRTTCGAGWTGRPSCTPHARARCCPPRTRCPTG